MKKRIISVMLVVFILCGALATFGACGPKDDRLQIVFWHTMDKSKKGPLIDEYIAKFEEMYPQYHVVSLAQGSYDDVRNNCTKAIVAGTEPCLAYCYPDHVALYNDAYAVQSLDEYINSTEMVTKADGTQEMVGLTQAQKDDFIEGYWNEGTQFGDDKMYTLPFSKSTEVLYYNKTFFEANNIPVPTHWWCDPAYGCDETCNCSMEKVCAKIKEIDPMSTPLGYDSEANWFITMCEQFQAVGAYGQNSDGSNKSGYTSATGSHFLFDNDVNKDFINRIKTWYNNGWLTTQNIYGTYTSGLFVETAKDTTKSYMSIGSSAGATNQCPKKTDKGYPFDVGIEMIPQIDYKHPEHYKVISQGPSLCMFWKKDPELMKATWLFMKYITTTTEIQSRFSMISGYVPVLKSVSADPIYAANLATADGGDGIAMLSAKQCLAQEAAYFTSPAFVGSSKARDQVGILLYTALGTPTAQYNDAKLNELFTNAMQECEY